MFEDKHNIDKNIAKCMDNMNLAITGCINGKLNPWERDKILESIEKQLAMLTKYKEKC